MANIVNYSRVRVYVPENGGFDTTRSMLVPQSDYDADPEYFGEILEEIPAGAAPNPWAPRPPQL